MIAVTRRETTRSHLDRATVIGLLTDAHPKAREEFESLSDGELAAELQNTWEESAALSTDSDLRWQDSFVSTTDKCGYYTDDWTFEEAAS